MIPETLSIETYTNSKCRRLFTESSFLIFTQTIW